MTAACLAVKPVFRAEPIPANELSSTALLKYRVVVVGGEGESFMTVRRTKNLADAMQFIDLLNRCEGCRREVLTPGRKHPGHTPSPMCEKQGEFHCDCIACWSGK
jgi:hypothetical protein